MKYTKEFKYTALGCNVESKGNHYIKIPSKSTNAIKEKNEEKKSNYLWIRILNRLTHVSKILTKTLNRGIYEKTEEYLKKTIMDLRGRKVLEK